MPTGAAKIGAPEATAVVPPPSCMDAAETGSATGEAGAGTEGVGASRTGDAAASPPEALSSSDASTSVSEPWEPATLTKVSATLQGGEGGGGDSLLGNGGEGGVVKIGGNGEGGPASGPRRGAVGDPFSDCSKKSFSDCCEKSAILSVRFKMGDCGNERRCGAAVRVKRTQRMIAGVW
jgi:hypothetical protein